MPLAHSDQSKCHCQPPVVLQKFLQVCVHLLLMGLRDVAITWLGRPQGKKGLSYLEKPQLAACESKYLSVQEWMLRNVSAQSLFKHTRLARLGKKRKYGHSLRFCLSGVPALPVKTRAEMQKRLGFFLKHYVWKCLMNESPKWKASERKGNIFVPSLGTRSHYEALMSSASCLWITVLGAQA